MKQVSLDKMFSTVSSLTRNWRFFIPFKKRIGYIGWLGRNNLGDEAMFLAIRALFSSLNILPFKETEKLNLLQEFKKGRIYDAIFLGGGTLIDKNYLNIFKEAKSNNKVKVVFGSGVRNPAFWNRIGIDNRLMDWKELLETCNFVGVRGPLSKKILTDHRFYKVEVIGDPMLNFARNTIKRKKRKKILGVNIGIAKGLVWGNEKQILASIIRLSKTLIGMGWKLKFLPVWDEDVPYIEEAVKSIGGTTEIFRDWRSVNKSLDFLEQCDLFIGEKLHSVILANCVYTPSIMLEYRPKCLDFMLSMDLGKFNVRTDELSIDMILNLVERLSEDLDCIQDKLFEKTKYYKKIQMDSAKTIVKYLTNLG